MMPFNQSPAPSEYSAYVGPVLLDAQHKGERWQLRCTACIQYTMFDVIVSLYHWCRR